MTVIEPCLELAGQMADAVRAEVMNHFRSGVQIDVKADASPVTIADRNAERIMRDMINAAFPEHGILGEEFGSENIDAEYVWVLDPIDGTAGFVTGKPLFGTLIALAKNGAPILGVIDAPAMNDRWVGAEGRATALNGKPVKTRKTEKLEDAWLAATTPDMFSGKDAEAFARLRAQFPRRTVWGNDCYAYGLLASGHLDLVVEASLGTYDYMALAPVVTGAGGVFSDWAGQPVNFDTDGRVVAAASQALHSATVAALNA